MTYKVDFTSLSWSSPMPGLRFKAFQQGGQQLRLVEYTKEMAPHWCEKGHVGYLLQGRFEIRYDREVLVYGPGEGIFIPAGPEHRHMARVLSDEPVRAIFVEAAGP